MTLGGRPLSGAKVLFKPMGLLGDVVPAAEGVTNELGVVRPSLGEAELPENLQGHSLIRPGLYLVGSLIRNTIFRRATNLRRNLASWSARRLGLGWRRASISRRSDANADLRSAARARSDKRGVCFLRYSAPAPPGVAC